MNIYLESDTEAGRERLGAITTHFVIQSQKPTALYFEDEGSSLIILASML
jgi:hypothetical protein